VSFVLQGGFLVKGPLVVRYVPWVPHQLLAVIAATCVLRVKLAYLWDYALDVRLAMLRRNLQEHLVVHCVDLLDQAPWLRQMERGA
jgi:hypothetical protein